MSNNNSSVVDFSRKWLVLGAVMLGSFLGPLDASAVNTILPEITGFFDTDISIAQWVPTVYLLTISCLILLYGRLGDVLGYKKIFVAGLVAFTFTSLLCGFSQSIWMLIAFRALQGLAAGMLMAVSYAIITSSFPPSERGKALGIFAVSIAVGLGLGPTLGGLITEKWGWEYIFFINVPVGLLASLFCYFVVPLGTTKLGQRLDIAGAAIAFIFLTCFLLFANRGQDWGWLSAASVSLIVLALLSGVAFLWVERRAEQPMLDLSLFHNWVFSLANFSALLSFMAIYAAVFLTPFYLALVLGYSVLELGLIMAASPLMTLFVGPLSGAASDRIGSRGLAVGGMCLCAAGLFLLSRLTEANSGWDVVWRLAIVGAGAGMFQSPNNSTVMGSIPAFRLGIASGILTAMRNVGMVLGIAIAGAVLYNLAPVAASGQLGPLDGSGVKEFIYGLRWAYIAGVAMAGISAVTSALAIRRV
jgi:EmrB/QacA subfamily drug resistance transporter